MNDATPDLGEPCPVGHPSGRIWQPPTSVEQARARVLNAMDNLEDSCRIGLDVGYALRCLDEVVADLLRHGGRRVMDAPERWLPVPEYEGLYEVSSHGQVWSAPRATTRGGLLKHIPDKADYRYVTLTKNGKQRRFQVHQLILAAFVGPCPEGMESRHLDGNPSNNRWAPGDEEQTKAAGGNLIYGTHRENIWDKKRHGTEWQSNVTHCPQDHEYTPENTLVFDGRRFCLTCKRDRGREAYHAKKAAGRQVWVPSADLPPDELEKRRARGREQQRRRQAEGLIPKFSELSPEQQEHVRELARERKRRYRERKRQQGD